MMMMLLLMLLRIDSCVSWSRVLMIILMKRSIDIGRVTAGHAPGINCMMISSPIFPTPSDVVDGLFLFEMKTPLVLQLPRWV